MASPQMSVIIPCYNHGEYLRDAVASVTQQTLSNIELLIVDDGSTDVETVQTLADLEAEGYSVLRQRNAGLSAARNSGIRASHGQYICCLDSDDILDPTYLEKAAWILSRRPDVGFVTSFVENFELNTFQWRPGRVHDRAAWWSENQAAYASVFRREAWLTSGGYDEQLKGYEDWDFWLGLLEHGYKPYQLPELLIRYRVKSDSMFTQVKVDHQRLVDYLHRKHVAMRPEKSDGHGTGFTRLVRALHLETFVRRHLWRDALILRDKGFTAWVKWRGYPIAKRFSVIIWAYRSTRRRRGIAPAFVVESAPSTTLLEIRQPDAVGVLFLIPWMEIGGADKVNLDLLRSLDRRYHPVVLTTLPSTHPWRQQFQSVTHDIFEMTSFPSEESERFDLLAHLIRTRNIRLVQVSNSELGYELLPYLSASGLPVVSLVHSSSPKDPWDYVRIAAARDAYIDRHVTVSDGLAKELAALGVSDSKITVIHNGIDTAFYSPGESSWLNKVGIENRPLVVSWIGRLSAEKQPHLFIEAMQQVFLRFNPSRLVALVVGAGPLEQEIRRSIKDMGLVGSVYCVGHRSAAETAEILRCTDVLVSTSQREGLPIIGLEAMASEVPIVATDIPGWRNLVISGVNGELCEPSPTAISQSIAELLESEHKRRIMGRTGRNTVLKHFALSDAVDKYQGLYDALADKAEEKVASLVP